MFDGSNLEFEENIRQTCEVVQMCHAWNISIEAELGAVGGGEGGSLLGAADPAKYTDIEQGQDIRSTNWCGCTGGGHRQFTRTL